MRTLMLNEIRLGLRQPLYWILTVVAVLFGYFVGCGIHTSQAELFTQAHLQHLVGALCMMALPWATGLLAVFSLYRADSYKMRELVLSASLSQTRQQMVQVAGLICLTILLGIVAATGLLAGLLSSANQLPEYQVILSVALNLQGLQLLIGLPASLLFVALFWLLHSLNSSPVLTYLATFLCFVSYTLLATAIGSPLMAGAQTPAPWLVSTMNYLDWFGLTPLMAKQPDLALVMLNRLLIILAATLLAYCAVRLKNRRDNTKKPAWALPLKRQDSNATTFHFIPAQPGAWHQLYALTRLQAGQIFKRPVIWLIGLIWCALVAGETYPSIHHSEPGAELTGLSFDAINRFMWDILPLFGSALLLYFSDLLSRRDKQLNIAGIVQALPIAPWTVLLARLLCLQGLLVSILLLAAGTAIFCQWLAQSPLQLAEYGRFMLYAGLPLAAQGTVFLAIQAGIGQRLAALCLCGLLLILHFTPLAALLDIHHPLARPFATPLSAADGFWGYAPNLDGFWALTRFWWLFAAVLLIGALTRIQGRGWPPQRLAAGLTCLLLSVPLILQGYAIQSGLELNGQYFSPDQRAAMLASYEKTYKGFANLPMPDIQHIRTEVDFYPDQRQVQIHGQYQLLNKQNQPIEQILVGENWQVPLHSISLNTDNHLMYDQRLGQRIFKLAKPLEPGQSLTLDFSLTLMQSGYSALPQHKILTREFSYLRAIPYFPAIGYLPIRELQSTDLRRKYGLPVKAEQSVEQSLAVRDKSRDGYQWSSMDTQISTPLGYQSFTQGELIRSWQQDNRQYRRFVTNQPVRNIQGFIAAPLALSSRVIQGLTLQVAYQPGHQANVPMTLDAMAQTVEFLSTHINPYNGKTLTLIEKPDLSPTGYALPQLILIGSRVGFRSLQNHVMPYSQAYRRAVHETAHQWFGHALGNGIEQDSAFLVESLAKYIELVMLERQQGQSAMQALVSYEKQRYLNAEQHNRQPMRSLISAESPHDQYSRATLVFARLRQAIGDQPILAALQSLGRAHNYPKPPASSIDFIQALINQVPEQRALIDMLFTSQVEPVEWLEQLQLSKEEK
ncbi:hypothetical protein GCM10009092_30040 [Bowmanella denitrificans]|uniref:Peptidase M1 membrane alanine aminopeptidase domain-containing protein n=1 Tax=Bowmanella denitrificans TaxID=366582 RepID=A0ABN0XGM5_9ALTE